MIFEVSVEEYGTPIGAALDLVDANAGSHRTRGHGTGACQRVGHAGVCQHDGLPGSNGSFYAANCPLPDRGPDVLRSAIGLRLDHYRVGGCVPSGLSEAERGQPVNHAASATSLTLR